jgi:hypothetical protein
MSKETKTFGRTVFNPSTAMKKRSIKPKPILWKKLQHDSKIFCKGIPPKNTEMDSCIKYKNKWVNAKYGISQVNQENSPLYIFKESNADENYSNISEGIHNFMLFWDSEHSQYELVTSYFNAIEFGSKHSMMAWRTKGLTAPEFVLSGEIKKNDNNIVFQNMSSQYWDNEHNLLKRMPFIYLNEIIGEYSSKKVAEENLAAIKRRFIGALNNPNFNYQGVDRINKTKNLDQLFSEMTRFPGHFAVQNNLADPEYRPCELYIKYVDIITNLMQDAFDKIFPNAEINVSYKTRFDKTEYKEQINIDNFLEGMCRLPFEFDVYEDEDACLYKRDKALYNSCNIPAIGMDGLGGLPGNLFGGGATCEGTTQKGQPCKKNAGRTGFCHLHE